MWKFAAVAAAVLLASCGGSEPQGARLRALVINDGGSPGALARRLEAEATQPTLTARDGAGQIVAALATSWRFVDDGRSLIMRLRPVKWSDGSSFKSSEVVDALRRAAERREMAIIHSGLVAGEAVARRRAPAADLGARAPISRVVELQLEAASPLLIDWLAEPGMAITQTGKNPATLAAYTADGPPTARVLTRKSDMAAPDRLPAVIEIATTNDSTEAVAKFGRGETDMVIGEGLAGLGNARAGAKLEALRIDPMWGVYGYVINAKRGALASPDVRRALAMAIDRTTLAARFGIGAIVPVDGLLPPSLVAAGAAPVGLAERRTEAQALLAAAGWTAENPLRLVLLLPPGRDHRTVAEAVGADLAQIGVTLAASEVSDVDQRIRRGEFDLAVTEQSLAVPDAGALLARWRCGGTHCNAAADALLSDARRALPADRPALLARAEAELMTGPPMISLFTPVRWALVARNVDGWVPNRAASHPLARMSVGGR